MAIDRNAIKEMFLKLKDVWQIQLWNEYCQRGDINDFKEYTIYSNNDAFFESLAACNIDLDFVMDVVRMVKNSCKNYDYNHKYVSYSNDPCDGGILLFSSDSPVDLMYQDADGIDSGFWEYLADKYFA